MDELEEIWREINPLAPLGDHWEEGTTSGTDEDDKNGADPQVEVGVRTPTTAAVWLFSDLKHFLYRCVGMGGIKRGGPRVGRGTVLSSDTLGWTVTVGVRKHPPLTGRVPVPAIRHNPVINLILCPLTTPRLPSQTEQVQHD